MTQTLRALALACLAGGPVGCKSSPNGGDTDDTTPEPVARIVIQPTTLTLHVGDSQQLSARAENSLGGVLVRPITWDSSAPAVATVADGLVTAVGVGDAAITARFEDVTSDGAAVTVLPVIGTLYIANGQRGNASVLAYDRIATASGASDPTRHIGSDVRGLVSMVVDATADRLYAASIGNGAILVYDDVSTKAGRLNHSRKISGPTSMLYRPADIIADPTSNKFYVTDEDLSWVYTFGSLAAATGDVAPQAILRGTSTALSGNRALAIDPARQRLYVGNASSITVYDASLSLSEDIAPIATISGDATTLSTPTDLLYDSRGDTLFVANSSANSVLAFAGVATLNGDVAPSRTITGSNTLIASPAGLTLDTTGGRDLLYVANGTAAQVLVFAASTADGDLAPQAVIDGPTDTYVIAHIEVDGGRDTLYRCEAVNDSQEPRIAAFTGISTASGAVTAARTIAAPTTFQHVISLAVDGVADRAFLLNEATGSNHTIQALDAVSTLDGDVAVPREIAGSAATLDSASALSYDATRDLLYVSTQSAVLVFAAAASADGDVAPVRQFGDGSWSQAPRSIAVDAGRDLLYVVMPPGSVLAYAAASTLNGGSIAPTQAMTGLDTGGHTVSRLTLDPAADRLFVTVEWTPAILVVDQASTQNGAITANRTITATALNGVLSGAAYFPTLDALVVSQTSSLIVFDRASTSDGETTDYRRIAGDYWLIMPGALAADPTR